MNKIIFFIVKSCFLYVIFIMHASAQTPPNAKDCPNCTVESARTRTIVLDEQIRAKQQELEAIEAAIIQASGQENPDLRVAIDFFRKPHIFRRDRSFAALGEAWRDPSGFIWGDTVLNTDGSPKKMTLKDAKEYCVGLNPPELQEAIRKDQAAGRVPAQGIFLPDAEDYVRLQDYMGMDPAQNRYLGLGTYRPQVLPNLRGHVFLASEFMLVNRGRQTNELLTWFEGVRGLNTYDMLPNDGSDLLRTGSVRCIARKK